MSAIKTKNKGERLNLIHALMAASNAFHATLKEHGYTVSYGLDDFKIGAIRKLGVPDHESCPVGKLTIKWNLDD